MTLVTGLDMATHSLMEIAVMQRSKIKGTCVKV